MSTLNPIWRILGYVEPSSTPMQPYQKFETSPESIPAFLETILAIESQLFPSLYEPFQDEELIIDEEPPDENELTDSLNLEEQLPRD